MLWFCFRLKIDFNFQNVSCAPNFLFSQASATMDEVIYSAPWCPWQKSAIVPAALSFPAASRWTKTVHLQDFRCLPGGPGGCDPLPSRHRRPSCLRLRRGGRSRRVRVDDSTSGEWYRAAPKRPATARRAPDDNDEPPAPSAGAAVEAKDGAGTSAIPYGMD